MKPLTPAELQYVNECLDRHRACQTRSFDDETNFCTKCGQSFEAVCDGTIACFGQPKITAISHIVRGSKLRDLMRSVLPWEQPDGAA